MRRSNAGVTLMELMVVMLVVGILAAIAIPSYSRYTVRASRADGKAALLSAAGALERCFTRFNSYALADGCAVVFPTTSTEGKYSINTTEQTAVAYTLQATAVAGQGQERDTECESFTLDSANSRGITGSGDVRRCWGR